MKRQTWILAGAAMLAALVPVGAVVTSGTAKSAANAHARSVSTAKVSQGELVATVAEDGTPSYRAQPDARRPLRRARAPPPQARAA